MLRPWSLAIVASIACVGGAARAQRPASAVVGTCIDAAEDAQRQSRAGHLLAARARTEQCLDARCPPAIRRDCDAFRTEVTRRIPSVVVRVRDAAGRDLADAALRLDDAVVPLDGRAREVDPGPHEVVASAPGFVSARRHVIVEEGSAAETIELRLTPLPVTVPVAETPAAPAGTSRAPITWIASGSLGAVGLVGLGLFTGLGLSTDADYRELQRRCEPRCTDAERDGIHRRYQVVDVALAVGVVAAVAAVVVYLVGPTRPVATSR
ncbi:MAG: hypothetical protein JWP97_5866 [Labilithrix sp.]|nr:hypothetical protein [Labilithrix sp.]